MSRLTKNYLTKINSLLDKILKEEKNKILSSARLIRDSYKKGGQLYIFGTGHSRLLGEEAFHRAGGFAAACPIRDDNLTFKKGAKKATSLERTPNIAKKALSKYKITNKDILMIVSNSGVNHAPVEAAMIAKQNKIKSIALTSVKYSKKAPLSELNKRLYEIVDVYIDNKIPLIGTSIFSYVSLIFSQDQLLFRFQFSKSVFKPRAYIIALIDPEPPITLPRG